MDHRLGMLDLELRILESCGSTQIRSKKPFMSVPRSLDGMLSPLISFGFVNVDCCVFQILDANSWCLPITEDISGRPVASSVESLKNCTAVQQAEYVEAAG